MENLTPLRMIRCGHFWKAANAVVCGAVDIGPDASLWFGAVLRGDVAPITVGARVNVQEHAVLHCDSGEPLTVGDAVTIGHGAVVHCASVGAGSLIGIKAVLLGGAVIGRDCLIAAGAIVSPRMVVPDGHVVMGVPGKVVRPLRDSERQHLRENNDHYVILARRHVEEAAGLYRL